MSQPRLHQQLTFLNECDKLKTIKRRNEISEHRRRENTAEHSWHMALLTALLAEYAAEPVDLKRALLMALVHDLVEIDAGDTFVYGTEGQDDKEQREKQAAERIYGLLPDDSGRHLYALWQEFERGDTPESRLVRAMDRLQPLLQHQITGGVVWREHGVRRSQVEQRMAEVETATPALWPLVQAILDQAVQSGMLGDQ